MRLITQYNKNKNLLFPKSDAKVLVDNDYIMASLGVLSKKYEESSLKLMLKSLRLEGDNICIQD